MEIHARTTKWSKGVKEMDVLSLQEKEIVCNKVAKQLFIICTTIGTLILIAITFGMLESPELLEYMTHTADSVNRGSRSALTSVFSILPLLAVMLIPTIAVFFGIKKPLLKRETRKLLEKKLGSTPITNDVLTSVYWALSNQEYISNDAFTKDIIDYIPDNKDNWNPYGIAVNTRKVCIVYEAFITGSEQLRSNEHIVDINDLDEENRIDGVFQTDIKVELSADNRRYFTNVELLRKIHNQVANKIVEGMDSFEGLEYVETVDGLPVYRVMIGD